MKNIAILQPVEMGTDFTFDAVAGVWKVNFPAPIPSDVIISPNVNNLIQTGSDGGAFVNANLLTAHSLVQDTVNQKIHLYRYPAGTTFDIGTAILVGSIDMVEMNGVFDDITVNANVITFTDAQNGVTITLDTDTLQRVSTIQSTTTIHADSLAGAVTLQAIVAPANLLTVTVGGLEVSKLAITDYINGLVAAINSQQSIRLNVGETNATVVRKIGNQALDIPQLAFVDSSGAHLAYGDDVTGTLVGYTA